MSSFFKKIKFARIYDQYVEKIYRFIFIKVSSYEVAQDLTSETFLKAWRVYKENNTEIKSISGFLYKIARNLVIDYYRQKKQHQSVSLETIEHLDIKSSHNPLASFIFDQELKRIYQAIKKIKPEYQEVIIWYYLDELSVKEIAKILDKSENAIRLLIHRGLKELRQILKEK